MYSGEHEVNPDDDVDWPDHYKKRAENPFDKGDLHPDAENQEVDSPPDLGTLIG